jgi:hypothetical protein
MSYDSTTKQYCTKYPGNAVPVCTASPAGVLSVLSKSVTNFAFLTASTGGKGFSGRFDAPSKFTASNGTYSSVHKARRDLRDGRNLQSTAVYVT